MGDPVHYPERPPVGPRCLAITPPPRVIPAGLNFDWNHIQTYN